MRRSREMAIRMATGASPANIFRQLLTESMLVALAGGVLGVTLAAFGSKLLIAYAARMTPLSSDIHPDARVLLFALGISLLTGILFGALPGYIASRVRITSLTDAGERTAGSESGTRLRNLLVGAQVTLSSFCSCAPASCSAVSTTCSPSIPASRLLMFSPCKSVSTGPSTRSRL